MRVLLVSANREQIPDPIFPLGLAYIAAAVRQAGHRVEVADLCFGRHPLRDLREQVAVFRPDVIGLSLRNVDNAAYPLTVDYLHLHREVIDSLRQVSHAPIVLGGSGFSILPEAYMDVLGADWGIPGEGEQVFVELLDALGRAQDPSGISGLVSRAHTSHADSTPPAPVVARRNRHWAQDLRPARDLFDYARYVRRGGTGNMQTKRGCVFRCSYCTYPLLEGNRFRCREAGDVVDELEALQRDYGTHPVFFVDSILNFPYGHVEALCTEILRRNLDVSWSCYATPVKLDQQQATLMARAGCQSIELGSDAADDRQLRRLGKSFDAETVERANRYCMNAGMNVCQTVLFGAPGETESSVRATCRVLQRMQPTAVVAMTGVRLYPGTPLTRLLIEQGHVREQDIGLLPAFYIDPAVADFLPGYLQQQAVAAGNWVLPGLAPPLLPSSQRILRGLGISGPLWRLLRKRWMHCFNRGKFRRPHTSWGVPNHNHSVFRPQVQVPRTRQREKHPHS
ncbi:MAG TPA: radical SAM protein [Gammaproteobacteria bacterium]|nr:radical SAM protein [Gammaproteobacteria bacterium]